MRRAAKVCLAKKEITVKEEIKDLKDREVKKEDWVLKATLDLLVPMESKVMQVQLVCLDLLDLKDLREITVPQALKDLPATSKA